MSNPTVYLEVRVRMLRVRDGERSVVSSSETEFDITRNLGQVRREPLARHVIREQAAVAAGDLIDSALKRAVEGA